MDYLLEVKLPYDPVCPCWSVGIGVRLVVKKCRVWDKNLQSGLYSNRISIEKEDRAENRYSSLRFQPRNHLPDGRIQCVFIDSLFI